MRKNLSKKSSVSNRRIKKQIEDLFSAKKPSKNYSKSLYLSFSATCLLLILFIHFKFSSVDNSDFSLGPVRKFSTSGSILHSPWVDDKRGLFLSGNMDGWAEVYRYDEIIPIIKFQTGSPIYSSGFFYQLNKENYLWTINQYAEQYSLILDGRQVYHHNLQNEIGEIFNAPVVFSKSQQILLMGNEGHLVCQDLQYGEIVWTIYTGIDNEKWFADPLLFEINGEKKVAYLSMTGKVIIFALRTRTVEFQADLFKEMNSERNSNKNLAEELFFISPVFLKKENVLLFFDKAGHCFSYREKNSTWYKYQKTLKVGAGVLGTTLQGSEQTSKNKHYFVDRRGSLYQVQIKKKSNRYRIIS